MKERLNYFMSQEHLSPSKLAEILDIQRSGLSHILSGRNKPGFDFINKFAENFPEINLDWLITGKGNIYKENPEPTPTLFNSDNKENRAECEPEYPAENAVKKNEPADAHKKYNLIKIILIYSDNTFIEYNPSTGM